jgi:hypothetical protein
VLWAWSGSGTRISYGDTGIDGLADSQEPWPIAAPGSYAVSVLALDASGKIIALSLPPSD